MQLINVKPIAVKRRVRRMHFRRVAPMVDCMRTRSYWDVIGVHLLPALASGIPLLLSLVASYHIIPLLPCTFLRLTGYPGPFCGFTRSIWAISAGDWAYATINCPLAWLVYAALVLVLTWNAIGLLLGLKIIRGPVLRLTSLQKRHALVLIGVLVLLNWAYRLMFDLH
jgi:hypothetical protein